MKNNYLIKIITLSVAANFSTQATCTTIVVNYVDGPYGSWTTDQTQAFDKAVEILESEIHSNVQIDITAYFENIADRNSEYSSRLAAVLYAPFESGFSCTDNRYNSNAQYVNALADKLAETNLSSSYTEEFYVFMDNLSSDPNHDWDYDYNCCPGQGQYDFISVALHALCHGIGFISSINYDDNWEPQATRQTPPYIFDYFVQDGNGNPLTSEATSGSTLTSYCSSEDIFWFGSRAKQANGNVNPELYAPSQLAGNYFQINHWDYDQFTGTDNDKLMTEYPTTNSFFFRHFGDVTRGLLKDIGWDDPATGVAESQGLLPNVYPNPSNGNLNVTVKEKNLYKHFEVLGIDGKLIIPPSYLDNDNMSLSLNPGIYIMRFYGDAQNHTIRLVIN